MTYTVAKQNFIESIVPHYPEGEARSIARIVFEDVFPSKGNLHFSLEDQTHLTQIQKRLLQDEPIQYILEQADFFGLKLKVSPAVLIPRQETEELVALVIETLGKNFKGHILDIGTGSGCIAIALKKKLKYATISACDISHSALEIAKQNAANHQAEINFFQTDILDKTLHASLAEYDVIISNPPYIPKSESALMSASTKLFEPAIALFVENEERSIFYNTISFFAFTHLKKSGHLFFELNEYDHREIVQYLADFKKVEIHKDLNGKDRMLSAVKG